jgi:hypothetical protein
MTQRAARGRGRCEGGAPQRLYRRSKHVSADVATSWHILAWSSLTGRKVCTGCTRSEFRGTFDGDDLTYVRAVLGDSGSGF